LSDYQKSLHPRPERRAKDIYRVGSQYAVNDPRFVLAPPLQSIHAREFARQEAHIGVGVLLVPRPIDQEIRDLNTRRQDPLLVDGDLAPTALVAIVFSITLTTREGP